METKKVVGYVRVSSPNQAKTGESLKTQRQQITAFAKSKGWELLNIYADEGLSGAKTEHRTAFNQMITDAKAGQFDVIVFTKLSRFARNARTYLTYRDELKDHKVLLASIKENPDPTSKMGNMIAGILAMFAEWELEVIREQMAENKLGRWSKHECFVGQPPYAYKWDKNENKLVLIPHEAEMYQRIVTMYLDQGFSFRDIAENLNSQGLTAKRAKWSNVAVSYILKNPAYYGNLVVNTRVYKKQKKSSILKRSKELKPANEHIEFPCPALISKTRWDQIQARIEFNKCKSKVKKYSADYWLRDVLKCARCGAPLKPARSRIRNDGTFVRYYLCYWRRAAPADLRAAGKTQKCTLPYISAKQLEAKIWSDIIVSMTMNPKRKLGALFSAKGRKSKVRALEMKAANASKELKKKERARERLFQLLEADTFDPDELNIKLRDNKHEIVRLEMLIKETQDELKELEEATKNEKEIEQFLNTNKEAFRQIVSEISRLSPDDKKIYIESRLDGPILVDYEEPGPDSAGGPTLDYTIKPNIRILQRFIQEGKISQFPVLDKNGYI
ncbi:MAG: hypothetical protein AVO38_10915 [delta proteobacterium ML8_D]|nr:MAG: hypothetical protein AVO34_05310 [Firmicutes bacterium ML8_F2]OPL15098.1 MAG: hypothetical protein AVO38_10915 [delta proteobacterium ML8_D]